MYQSAFQNVKTLFLDEWRCESLIYCITDMTGTFASYIGIFKGTTTMFDSIYHLIKLRHVGECMIVSQLEDN